MVVELIGLVIDETKNETIGLAEHTLRIRKDARRVVALDMESVCTTQIEMAFRSLQCHGCFRVN